ncbi:uncharacterized protein LOC131153834 [Malania oleifera]|uniref:uncharacterized protein LOC131153834 n=1 Tax=Malania oleifera TaxID=397392 RepID=UPI0025AEB7C4|nr:uncharacterized protein LOC131153834 [Malania oleifera]
MAQFEALYGRRCWSPLYFDEVRESQILGPELVQQAFEKVRLIRDRIKSAHSRKKSYMDVRCRELEFEVGGKIFLIITPIKGVTRFGNKGKLSLRYIGPFEVLERVSPIAYRIALPPALSWIHDVFHISMLRRYVSDLSYVIHYESLEIGDSLAYKVIPVQILD